ncbi:uncharacterized protein [Amphiura filiformis]|uniref:uncharacterized protein n=1 Tax=Amphiura filiformis TaxID=82378 RepID=UPI003B218A8C
MEGKGEPEHTHRPDHSESSSSDANNASANRKHKEPVEDEYHGSVVEDSNTVYSAASSDHSKDHISHSSSGGLRSDYASADTLGSHLAGVGVTDNMLSVPEAIHRIASLEARMDLQERVHEMTQHELTDTRNQISELQDNPKTTAQMQDQLKALRDKTDMHLSKLEQDKDRLLIENQQLRQAMLDNALSQAEKERRMLAEFDRKLEEKVEKLKNKLKCVCEERDQVKIEAKLRESTLNNEKASLRRDRDNWKKRSVEADRENQTHVEHMTEQKELLDKKEKILIKFEEQCKVVTKENIRLRRENSFLQETIFHVVRVGSDALSDAATNAPPDVVFECYSCHNTYTSASQQNNENNCRFHPLPAMHFREWSRWPIGKDAIESARNKLYWPCCDTLSYSRPVGCCMGRHHQSWERDIIMKTVLSSKENLDWD